MKTYIATEWFSYEGENLLGVFSTLEKAQAFLKPLRDRMKSGRGYSVYECELDSKDPPKDVEESP